ncbi:protein phosphatase regulator [Sporothrix curviconia]|uniref:Protein phosphatase regulator n=1 Tax=Sporothrix curviconia TaxID=1260050 RepID=A0ABP0BUB8_9PEZI
MAVVITSDEAAHFAPGIRRSHSQPKFSSKQTGFRQSASASKVTDVYRQQQQQQQPPLQRQPSPQSPSSAQQIAPEPYQQIPVFSDSSASSAASSPRANATGDAAIASSPSKLLVPSLRLPGRLGRPGYGSSPNGTDDGTDGDVAIDYPHYDGVSYFNPDKDYDPPSPRTASPNDNNTVSSAGPTRTDSSEQFDMFEHVAEDDTAVRTIPSRHVDYLSHNWKEEDIWESWKYIVSRRGDYSNSARLENASWRTWMKSKNKLKTVSPETLNWLKDCDVTWLYGPLQTGHITLNPAQVADSVELTKSNSFLASQKKPILKKRSMSEIMLQRSLSASSLIKQAAAAVQAQQKDSGARRMSRPRLERATTDYVTFPFSSRQYSTGPPSMLPSTSSSGIVSPSSERRHIHFNEQVEQCIAVDVKGDDEDDSIMTVHYNYDSDSDDGAIMMKRTASKPRMQRRRSSHAHPNESKTIAMLPSTTLKYREDTLELPGTGSTGSAMKHSYRSPVLSPSSSQETLRPSKTSGKFFHEDDDDDEEQDEDEDDEISEAQYVVQQPEDNDDDDDHDDDDDSENDSDDRNYGMSMGGPKRHTIGLLSSASTSRLGGHSINSALHASSTFADNSLGGSSSSTGSGGGGLKRTTSTNSLSAEPAGMRRTASGMFMPYDEGEPAGGANGGLLGRVIDTVNTARDIVHVIWNVGWNS